MHILSISSIRRICAVFATALFITLKGAEPGLVAYYKLDGNAIDSSENGLNGALNGTSPVPDRFGQTNSALRFNGVSDLINLGNPPQFQFNGSFTLSVWAKANGSQASKYILAKYPANQEGAPNSYGLGTDDQTARPYGFVSVPGTFLGYRDTRGGSSLNDGVWHSLALVYNAGAGIRLFQDGSLVASNSTPALPPFTNMAALTIGGLAGGQYFNGDIDDARVFSRSLSDSEISDLYQLESQGLARTVRLQNATATFSQTYVDNFFPFRMINGTDADNRGWAIYPQITNQTAVFETVTNIGTAAATLLTFKLNFNHISPTVGTTHTLGRFRISVTTDSRDSFADGLATGGDVTANWTVLDITEALSSAGATLTKLPDGSILVSGIRLLNDTYTLSGFSPVSGITGVRLEALQDPSLPHNGPGRVTENGNFVVSEFSLTEQTDLTRLDPRIVTQPVSVAVPFGDPAAFRVIAESFTPLQYQWRFNGAPIPGATNSTLTLGAASVGNEGTYSVAVSNDAGTVSSAGAVLHVKRTVVGGELLFRNRTTNIDAPISDAYGERLTGADFLVQLYAGPSLSELQPIGPAVPFGVDAEEGYFSDSIRVVPTVSAGSPAVVHLRVWEAAAGPTYEEAVANGGSYGFSEVLTVQLGGSGNPPTEIGSLRSFALFGKPRISFQPVGVSTTDGSNAVLTVQASGTQPLFYQWYKNGNVLTNAMSASLTFTNLAVSDSGSYLVAITNAFGAVTSAPAVLDVREVDRKPPVITIASPEAGLTDLDRVALSGTIADNVQVARAEWFHNGEVKGSLPVTNGKFSIAVNINRGTNILAVVAYDAEGNAATNQVVIVLQAAREISILPIASAQDGSTVKIPITVRSKGEIGGISLTLNFSRDYLAEPNFSWFVGSTGVFSELNTNIPGQVRASFALSGATLPAGTNTLAVVTFRVRSIPSDLDSAIDLDISGVYDVAGRSIMTGTDVVDGKVRLLRRKYIADNNANDLLDVGDASILMRLVTLLDPLRSWDVALNDLNLNSRVDVGDVIQVLRVVVGIDPQPGPLAQSIRSQLVGGQLPQLVDASTDRSLLSPGETMKLSVKLSDFSEPVSGASFTVTFPTNALRLRDSAAIRVGSAPPSSALSMWNLEPAQNDFSFQSGVLHFAVGSGTTWVSSPASNSVLELTFDVLNGALALHSIPVGISKINVSDGFNLRSAAPKEMVLLARDPVPVSFSGPIGLQNGAFEFRGTAELGLRYSVEASSDLVTWTRVGTLLGKQDGFTFSDPIIGQPTRRFYRLILAD